MPDHRNLLFELYREGRVAWSKELAAILTPSHSDRPRRRLPSKREFDLQHGIVTLSDEVLTMSVLSVGSFQTPPAEIHEMEDWEIAPGVIKQVVPASNKIDTVAFSKPALSSHPEGIPVCEDVFVRVDTILPGQVRRFPAKEHHLQLVSISGGKVRVNLDTKLEFQIGHGGMFKIRPGVVAVVMNCSGSSHVSLNITTLAQ